MKRLALCLLAACTLWSGAVHAQSYTFTTLAGLAGTNGSADGTGTNAVFNYPMGIALDGAGYIYVADCYNSTIRKISPGGVVSTLAGLAGYIGSADGRGSDARFDRPWGIAVDGAGYIYVADNFKHTIRKISPDGVVSTLAGLAGSLGDADGRGSDARFNKPKGVAVDGAGNIYVGDASNHTIRKISPDGVVSTLAGLAGSLGDADGPGSDARFNYPQGVDVDGVGNVYVADGWNSAIRKIAPDGVVSTLVRQFLLPSGVAVDSAGNVYWGNTWDHTIRKITPDGAVSILAGSGLAGRAGSADGPGNEARFNAPCGVAVDASGNIYVADAQNHTIRLGRLPSLRFSLAADRLILSWPQSASNYIVEASSTLSPAVWTPLTNPVGIWGDSFVVTNTMDEDARFYRLRAP